MALVNAESPNVWAKGCLYPTVWSKIRFNNSVSREWSQRILWSRCVSCALRHGNKLHGYAAPYPRCLQKRTRRRHRWRAEAPEDDEISLSTGWPRICTVKYSTGHVLYHVNVININSPLFVKADQGLWVLRIGNYLQKGRSQIWPN